MLVLTVAAVGGLAIGLLVVATVSGERQPATYRPFFAGMKADRAADIRKDGPVLIPDPRGGDRAFYLDLEGDEVIALHVVPPGGDAGCPVQYDHDKRRYEDCRGGPVSREALGRFTVSTRPTEDGKDEAVLVDLRRLEDPAGR
ncbi:MAG: hypothetical protein ACRDZ3_10360 [Acidimicrobiia bacterium]